MPPACCVLADFGNVSENKAGNAPVAGPSLGDKLARVPTDLQARLLKPAVIKFNFI